MWDSGVDAFQFGLCVVVKSGCLSAFDVVCYEFGDCIWYVSESEFLYECVELHCVEGLAHIQGHGNSAEWWFLLVKAI